MIQRQHLTLIGRAGLALVGAGTVTMLAMAVPAAAETAPQSVPSFVSAPALNDEPSGTGSGPNAECSTAAGAGPSTGSQASEGNDSGGAASGSGCTDNSNGPGGPGYNGVDPRG